MAGVAGVAGAGEAAGPGVWAKAAKASSKAAARAPVRRFMRLSPVHRPQARRQPGVYALPGR